jgi:hypothetical protein
LCNFYSSTICRLPIDAYNDGEVSFSLSKSARRRLVYASLRDEFSDDESDDAVPDADKKSMVVRLFSAAVYLGSILRNSISAENISDKF